MKTHIRASLVAIGAAIGAAGAGAAEIQVFWTDNPPLICQKNGELDCMAGILIKNAAKAGGYTLKATQIPWARALDMLDNTPNAMFASTGRNEFSEKSFNWYMQVYSDKVNIFTLDAKKLASDADIGKLSKVAIRRGSPFPDYLIKRGHGNRVFETNDWQQAVGMLDLGRVDAMCLTNLIGTTNLVQLGKLAEARINRYPVGEMSWYVITASNKPVSADLQAMKKLMEAEKAKPYFQDILKGYKVQN
jgi:ABC-type amino acid transport substrate-binding protein